MSQSAHPNQFLETEIIIGKSEIIEPLSLNVDYRHPYLNFLLHFLLNQFGILWYIGIYNFL